MEEDNVIELRPGIRQSRDEVDEGTVLDSTAAMVALALLAQKYERDIELAALPIEDVKLCVHVISPLCTLLQKNPSLAIDLLWQINEIIGDCVEDVEYD